MSDDKPQTVVSKLVRVMEAVGHIEKRGYNEFHKYKYVLESDVLEAVRKAFIAEGLLLIPEVLDTARTPIGDKGSVVTHVMMLMHIYDTETGQELSFRWQGDGQDSGDKGLYKALTGGYKYFLMKMLLVSTGDDPERTPSAKPKRPTTTKPAASYTAPTVTEANVPVTLTNAEPTDPATRFWERIRPHQDRIKLFLGLSNAAFITLMERMKPREKDEKTLILIGDRIENKDYSDFTKLQEEE